MNQNSVVLVSAADVFAPYHDVLSQFRVLRLVDPQYFMKTLIEERAAMIFVDAQHDDWKALILTCKSNAATRRIPLCLVSDAVKDRAIASASGADFALSWAELSHEIAGIVSGFARIPNQATMSRLDCECLEPLPALAAEGFRHFNSGEYYRQHDLFEEQWVNTDGPVRDLYRAILQVGVAYYQIEQGNYRGALKMLQRSIQWLFLLPDTCQGIDVSQLRRDSYRVRAELQRLGPERLAEFNRSLIKPLQQKSSQSPST